jgi:hypothetical protein
LNIIIISAAAVVILALIVFFIIWMNKVSGKRAEDIGRLALSLNFRFSPKDDGTFIAELSKFQLFSKGQSRKISNILSGNYSGTPVIILDYQYTTGGGESTHTWRQTVLIMESEKLALPLFTLRPENVFDKIGNALGYKDIDFPVYPKFSKQYFLRSKDETAVRNIFTDSLIQYYEQRPGLNTEGDGQRLVYYHGPKIVPADKIQEFLQQGHELFSLFRHW